MNIGVKHPIKIRVVAELSKLRSLVGILAIDSKALPAFKTLPDLGSHPLLVASFDNRCVRLHKLLLRYLLVGVQTLRPLRHITHFR